ncbi:Protein ASYMMETRIC LEAVES 2 [Linum perenne]
MMAHNSLSTTTTTTTSSTSTSSSSSPCAACKFLRRKCQPECVFSPYFPPDQPQKFANVHKVFGASNVTKLLNELHPSQREDAVNSLAYEADMRLRDPVYGCVGVISLLQHQLRQLQLDLTCAKSQLCRYHQSLGLPAGAPISTLVMPQQQQTHQLLASGGINYNYLQHQHQHQQQIMMMMMRANNNNIGIGTYNSQNGNSNFGSDLLAMNVMTAETTSIGQLSQFQQSATADNSHTSMDPS